MTKYKAVNHIAYATNDMDKTIRFWRDLLGMRLIGGVSSGKTKQYFFEITEDSMISFFEWPDVEAVPDKDPGSPVKGPFSHDHICLEVDGEDDLWNLKDRLEAADFWITEVMDNGFIHSFFSTDPNNIQLEFCYKVNGMSLSKNPHLVDTAPSAVTLEGVDPQKNKWPDVKNPTLSDNRKIYPGPLIKLAQRK